MQHESHIEESSSGTLSRIIAVLAIVVGIAAIGAYVVYGSGMWNPPQAHSAY